jgi:hypothetical protein
MFLPNAPEELREVILDYLLQEGQLDSARAFAVEAMAFNPASNAGDNHRLQRHLHDAVTRKGGAASSSGPIRWQG